MCPTAEEFLQYKEVVDGDGGGFGSGKRGWPKGSKNGNKIGVQNDCDEICIFSVNGSSIEKGIFSFSCCSSFSSFVYRRGMLKLNHQTNPADMCMSSIIKLFLVLHMLEY